MAHTLSRLVACPSFVCNLCYKQGSGPVLHCPDCQFQLHFTCSGRSEPPRTIHHPSHAHALTLFPPQATGARRSCDGCGLSIATADLFYRCQACNFDLHPLCASLPSRPLHPLHPQHRLTRLDKPYYPGGSFTCDNCGQLGSNWVYHCSDCRFDLHPHCANLRHIQSAPPDMPRSVGISGDSQTRMRPGAPSTVRSTPPRPRPVVQRGGLPHQSGRGGLSHQPLRPRPPLRPQSTTPLRPPFRHQSTSQPSSYQSMGSIQSAFQRLNLAPVSASSILQHVAASGSPNTVGRPHSTFHNSSNYVDNVDSGFDYSAFGSDVAFAAGANVAADSGYEDAGTDYSNAGYSGYDYSNAPYSGYDYSNQAYAASAFDSGYEDAGTDYSDAAYSGYEDAASAFDSGYEDAGDAAYSGYEDAASALDSVYEDAGTDYSDATYSGYDYPNQAYAASAFDYGDTSQDVYSDAAYSGYYDYSNDSACDSVDTSYNQDDNYY